MTTVLAFTVPRQTMIDEVNSFLNHCASQVVSHNLPCSVAAVYVTTRVCPCVEVTIYIHRNGNRVVGHVFALTTQPVIRGEDVLVSDLIDKITNSVDGLLQEGLSSRARMPNGIAPPVDEEVPSEELRSRPARAGLQQASHERRDLVLNVSNLNMVLIAARNRFRDSAQALGSVLQQLNSGKSEARVGLNLQTDLAKIGVIRALHRRGFDVRVESNVLVNDTHGQLEVTGLSTVLLVTRSGRTPAVRPYAINWQIADDIPSPPYDHHALSRLKGALAEYGSYINDPDLSDGVIDDAAL